MASIGELTPILTPFILGGGTIMAMVSLRSSDIANRSRAIVSERQALATQSGKTGDTPRQRNLNLQTRIFFWRYVACSASFLGVAISIGLCIWAAKTLFATSGDASNAALAADILQTAQWFFYFGLLLCVGEFTIGPWTLHLNNQL